METVKSGAQELKVSERFLRQLITDNRIPYYRLSERTIRVDLDELRSLMRDVAQGKPCQNGSR
jgi:excisionase family DNA binding protein